MIEYPEGFERWSRALQGAFKKGCAAYAEGVGQYSSPYDDKRNINGGLTWSRAFDSAWRDGWLWAQKRAQEGVAP